MTWINVRFEKLVLGAKRLDLRSERSDLEYVGPDLGLERPDLRSKRPVLKSEQVAQGQYVVSDIRCPALHDCELE